MTYRVVYTQRVVTEIKRQVDYLREQHAGEAVIENWFSGLFDRIESLYDMPRLYGIDHAASQHHGHTIRKLTYKNYIVRYRIDESTNSVYVLAFQHGSRQRLD